MEIIHTSIPDVLIIKPDVIEDDRGYFFESYHIERFKAAGIDAVFVQDNESKSQKHVLRGLHFQRPPYAQGKLIRVIKGAVLDVVVDLRKASLHFGKSVQTILSEENKLQFWVPPGFAHGFVALEDNTIFSYKCTNYYNREAEMAIRWNDPELAIDWGVSNPVLSKKDQESPFLNEIESPF